MSRCHRRGFLHSSLALAGACALAPAASFAQSSRRPLNEQLSGHLTGLHDPLMIKEGGVYHVFGSGGWSRKPGPSWRGQGHCGLIRDGDRDLIVYHAYDAQNDAMPTLRLAELQWSPDGWPVALT